MCAFSCLNAVQNLIVSQFISLRMRESEIWKYASDAEFDNAMEGMEKLVMNRLYDLFVLLSAFLAPIFVIERPVSQYIHTSSHQGCPAKANNV